MLRLRRLGEQFRQSLFFLPSGFVAASLVLATGLTELDRSLEPDALPSLFDTTVDNARSILSTVAAGTIGAASVVFSLTLVAVQLASTQYSPRVVRGFLRDRFQQVAMGSVVGTFTYSLVVLRAVRSPLDDTGETLAFQPRLSVLFAVILGVTSLVAVLGSIDHTAKALRVGSIINRITDETIAVIHEQFPRLDQVSPSIGPLGVDRPASTPAPGPASSSGGEPANLDPPDDALVVRCSTAGWVTQVSTDGLIDAMPSGSTLSLHSSVGTYLLANTPLASLWPVDDDRREHVSERIRSSIELRPMRTMQQDPGFGLLQLVDIALRALSPGVNDPNTANDVVVRVGSVLVELLSRQVPDRLAIIDDRVVVRASDNSHADYVDLVIDPIRRHARTEPGVLATLVRTLQNVAQRTEENGGDISALTDQLASLEADLYLLETDGDRRMVERALSRRSS